jgi:hypothetical protein
MKGEERGGEEIERKEVKEVRRIKFRRGER